MALFPIHTRACVCIWESQPVLKTSGDATMSKPSIGVEVRETSQVCCGTPLQSAETAHRKGRLRPPSFIPSDQQTACLLLSVMPLDWDKQVTRGQWGQCGDTLGTGLIIRVLTAMPRHEKSECSRLRSDAPFQRQSPYIMRDQGLHNVGRPVPSVFHSFQRKIGREGNFHTEDGSYAMHSQHHWSPCDGVGQGNGKGVKRNGKAGKRNGKKT